MKASSESGECASLISTVCSPVLRVAGVAVIAGRASFVSAATNRFCCPCAVWDREGYPREQRRDENEKSKAAYVAQCRVWLFAGRRLTWAGPEWRVEEEAVEGPGRWLKVGRGPGHKGNRRGHRPFFPKYE